MRLFGANLVFVCNGSVPEWLVLGPAGAGFPVQRICSEISSQSQPGHHSTFRTGPGNPDFWPEGKSTVQTVGNNGAKILKQEIRSLVSVEAAWSSVLQ